VPSIPGKVTRNRRTARAGTKGRKGDGGGGWKECEAKTPATFGKRCACWFDWAPNQALQYFPLSMKHGTFQHLLVKKKHVRGIRLAAASCLLALMICGCSSFNRDWKRTPAAPEGSVEGRWQGQWVSDANNHQGKLRCLLSRDNNTNNLPFASAAPDTNSTTFYQARFHATFLRWFHFNYTAQLEMQPHDIGWEFDGEADLGKFAGGVYYYEGRASTTNLVSLYRAKHDHGHFELKRPPSPSGRKD